MTHGSLFSGIGGFDLASEWMGWENKFHCEWNEFGQKVLHHYWPNAELFTDIKKSDFKKYANKIDILSGGFPCQPYSSAGKRLGKEDSRHLWPEMRRAIREIQPRWVVGENVRGLTNWNGGLVFDEVQADLEAEGYEVTPFLLPACAVGAPHRRDRIWFVAHSKLCSNRLPTKRWLDLGGNILEGRERKQEADGFDFKHSYASNTNGNGLNECNGNHEINTSEGRFDAFSNTNESNGNGDVTDTLPVRLQQCEDGKEMGRGQGEMGRKRSESSNAIETNGKIRDAADTDGISNQTRTKREVLGQSNREETNGHSNVECRNQWQNFPTQSPICTGDDGISDRLDGITFPKWRNESIKAAGNAIVPQVVLNIFRAIEMYENI